MRTTVASLVIPISLLLMSTGCGGDEGCPAGSMAVGDRCIAVDAGEPGDARVDGSSDMGADDAGDGSVDGGGVMDDGGSDACVATGAETCNGVDDNCDGTIDEGFATMTHYADADGDTFGDDASEAMSCALPAGRVLVGGDCEDTLATANPDGTEMCNGIDDNCDMTVDEGVTTLYYPDGDGDGYANTIGKGTEMAACSAPAGYAAMVGDCNDSMAGVHPGATETCNSIDDNCNGTVDEGFATMTHYADVDGDTWGDSATVQTTCATPLGRVTRGGDCNDTVATIFPGRTETCNGVDDNCSGAVDEGLTSTFYRDMDADTYGSSTMSMVACTMPVGYVANSTDCNDAVMTVHPLATELCNATDDDCDAVLDDGFACVRGASASCTTTCGSTGTGTCTTACATPPAAMCTPPTESCNRFDDDCDGLIDEGSALAWSIVSDLGRPAADQVMIVGNGVFYAALSRIGATVVVRQLDTTMTPTGSDVTVASDANVVAMTLSGSDVVVAWIAAGVVYAKRAPLTTLAFPGAATTVVDPAGVLSAIDVASSGGNLLFAYVSGQDIYGTRTNGTFGTPTANTLLVDGADLGFRQFDLAPAAAGGWAVAYSDQLATETDREVFLQGIAASGIALDGAAFRTTDATNETFPALAYDATGDRLAMAWIDGTTARVNTFRLAGTGPSRAITAERVTPAVIAAAATVPTYLLATPLALDVAAGSLLVAYAATSVESTRYDLATLASIGTGRVTVTYAGIESVGVVTPVGTSGGRTTLLPARAIANRDLSTRAFLLSCP